MRKLDEDILRAYFRLEEAQRQRLWMERLFHPEKMNWKRLSAPPPMTVSKRIRLEELTRLGFGEAHYQRMLEAEAAAREELESLVEGHPLWLHFQLLNRFGKYLAGAFIAAGGDIEKAPTCSAFWKGMGLDVLPDGTVPRRVRGARNAQRGIPALPHVTRVGEQIRQQILRSGGRLYQLYRTFREKEPPDKPKLFAHKSALRKTQKVLYACLWRQWRLAYGLEAPLPYAFDILHHPNGHLITIEDLYDKAVQHQTISPAGGASIMDSKRPGGQPD